MEIDGTIEERKIPSFLLQPLVENAIKFGKLTSPDHLEIRIGVQGRENHLHLEVANTGSWVDEKNKDEMHSTGVGLENLRNSIEKIYPGEACLSRKSENGWVIMGIDIP